MSEQKQPSRIIWEDGRLLDPSLPDNAGANRHRDRVDGRIVRRGPLRLAMADGALKPTIFIASSMHGRQARGRHDVVDQAAQRKHDDA